VPVGRASSEFNSSGKFPQGIGNDGKPSFSFWGVVLADAGIHAEPVVLRPCRHQALGASKLSMGPGFHRGDIVAA
jgi:hypothetical protein